MIKFKSPVIKALPGFAGQFNQPVLFCEITLENYQSVDLTTVQHSLMQLYNTDELQLDVTGKITAQHWADLLLASVVFLQQQARHPVYIKGIAEPLAENNFCLSIPYFHGIAIETLQWTVGAINHLLNQPHHWQALQKSHQAIASKLKNVANNSFNTNTGHFFDAAFTANIPYFHLVDKIYQFGYGVNSRRLNSSITDITPSLSVALARDKLQCAQLLRTGGFPVPAQGVALNLESALKIAEKLGYPVVIKPIDQDKGVGVAAGLIDAEAVKRAFAEAIKHSKRVLVEKHVEGYDYRISVIEGKVEQIVERVTAHAVGDGVSNVLQLVDNTNADPRRSPGKQQTLKPIIINDETHFLLAEQGLSLQAIPQLGHIVKLARIANVAVGGVSQLVDMSQVHPDNLRLFSRVTVFLGLDFAGLDFLVPDITRPWYQQICCFCEVNAQPQIGVHTEIVKGSRYKAVFKWILKNEDGRIPIVAFIGDTVKTEKPALLAHKLLTANAVNAGLTCSQGSWIGSEQVSWQRLGAFAGGRLLLSDKAVEIAVMPLNFNEILNQGAVFDVCDVAVLLNTVPNQPVLTEPYSPSALASLNVSVLQRARKAVILNADDELCLAQRQFLTEQEVVLVSVNNRNSAVLAHIQQGGRAVWLETSYNQPFICFYQQKVQTLALPGNALFSDTELLFSVAAAWLLEIPLSVIETGVNALE